MGLSYERKRFDQLLPSYEWARSNTANISAISNVADAEHELKRAIDQLITFEDSDNVGFHEANKATVKAEIAKVAEIYEISKVTINGVAVDKKTAEDLLSDAVQDITEQRREYPNLLRLYTPGPDLFSNSGAKIAFH